MKNARKPRKGVPAEAIARLADQGSDVSRFFTNSGRMLLRDPSHFGNPPQTFRRNHHSKSLTQDPPGRNTET